MKAHGGEKRVYIAFSAIASDSLIAAVSKALSEISADSRLTMVISHAAVRGDSGGYLLWIGILSAVIVLLLAAAGIVFWRVRRRQKRDRASEMVDRDLGIGNARYYEYCFNNMISDKSRALYYAAYIAFDEENFSRKYGADESFGVLRAAAEFIGSRAGAVDYAAAVGSGVFALLYQCENRQKAEQRIADTIRELNTRMSDLKAEYAGIFFAGVCSLEENADSTAESAFYSAKQGYLSAVSSRSAYEFSSKTAVAAAHRRERLRGRVRQAIANGEFTMYLQYIVDKHGNLFGAEAVSRWRDPTEGLLGPSEYIGMISQSEVVTLHDLYIFSLVCQKLEEWGKSGHGRLSISCNFTRYSIAAEDFADRIREVADRYDFDRGRLIIEVTEDSFAYRPDDLKRSIEKCREMGFLIALDDIGSGYSSLSDLRSYPIDFVKVEKVIVSGAETPQGEMLLRGLVRLAHSMNIVVLCEGVETEALNTIVKSAGCDYIQGYLYSRALPPSEAKRYLENYASDRAAF